MLFMDWRDKHLHKYKGLRARNNALPTFLYAMPFSSTRIFVEETSLVARPSLSFDDLKARMYARLAHLGIKVRKRTVVSHTMTTASVCEVDRSASARFIRCPSHQESASHRSVSRTMLY
jgi:lycopene cyclase-like protein